MSKHKTKITPNGGLLDLRMLLDSGLFADAIIVSADGEHFAAHHVVLARLPHFRAAFSSDLKEGTERKITLPESSAVVELLLQFIYDTPTTGYYARLVAKLLFDDLVTLHETADKYLLGNVSRLTWEALEASIATIVYSPHVQAHVVDPLRAVYCGKYLLAPQLALVFVRKLAGIKGFFLLPANTCKQIIQEVPGFVVDLAHNIAACSILSPTNATCPMCEQTWQWKQTLQVALREDQIIDCRTPGCGAWGLWLIFNVYWHLVQAWSARCLESREQQQSYAHTLLLILHERNPKIEALKIWNTLHNRHAHKLLKE